MFGARTLAEPTAKNTIIHRIDPRTKIVLLVTFSILVVTIDRPETLLGLFLVPLVFYPFARLPWIKLKFLLIAGLLMFWGIMISQAIFYETWPRTIIFTLVSEDTPIIGTATGGIYIYKEGFLWGATQALRSTTMLSLGLLFAWTTEPRDLLLGLTKIKMPYKVAFMVVTSVKFISTIFAEASTVIAHQKLKGFKPLRPRNWGKAVFIMFVPILVSCIRKAGTLALSVECRGFGARPSRTYLRELKIRPLDVFLMLFPFICMIIVVVMKIIFLLYISETYYNSDFRIIYDFTRTYL